MSERYNFTDREEHWRKFWESEEIFKFNPHTKKPIYSVDTPPPYVSADHLHPGHIMSYSQAEFVVRYKRMAGCEVYYPMGFDDNGLPTERYVEKKYNLDKNKISRADFIAKCLAETKIGVQTYRSLWRLLGISVDWSKTYSTIDAHCQRISQWSFLDLYKKGKLERRDEPTSWCPACQTAVSQADLEDKEEDSNLNYINFSGSSGQDLLIATTRPELLPACVALFVNPQDKRYLGLISQKVTVPIFGQTVPILTDESVDINFGTGLMMVCTWGDTEDVRKYRLNNLPSRAVINPNGTLGELAGEFSGLSINKARAAILEKLQASGKLVKQEKIKHVLNVHERCGTPVELIQTKQWFIKVLNIKDQLIKQADKMKWYPQYMKQRYLDWTKSLQWDWCISRQRYYGVPFPVWYCADCGEEILPAVEDLPVDPTVQAPKIKACPKCKSTTFVPEKDVMDTWMTSSMTPNIGAELFEEKVAKKLYPATLRPQAYDIIRTWLFYAVVKSFYHFQSIPFRDIMISGHGQDSKGQKFSKRLGNFVSPDKVISQFGADAMRYWTTGANLGENLRYNEDEIKRGSRAVTKIFNVAKFCLGHFVFKDYSKMPSKLEPEDVWILSNLNHTILAVTKHFEEYQYAKAVSQIDDFFWNQLCDNYIEFVKPRLYADTSDETAKAVLYRVLLSVIRLYAPILPFITEEVYQQYFVKFEKVKSIHLSSWPKNLTDIKFDKDTLASFGLAVEAVAEIRKYKSEQKISLGKEIEDYKLQTKVDKKYLKFIGQVIKVKNLQ
ncbi:MAG: valine--tRNA ligase [Patescibacteria group bacterium]